MSKVKVIFIGDLTSADAVETLWKKLSKVIPKAKLQICFGRCSNEAAFQALLKHEFPIPLYLQDSHAISSYTSKQQVTQAEEIDADSPKDKEDSSPCWKIMSNIYVLRDRRAPGQEDSKSLGTGIWSIPIAGAHHDLVVASLPARYRSHENAFETATHHVSYVGCDVLLSTEWPQGIEALTPQSHDISYDVGMAALKARAQYQVATTNLSFCQTPAFAHSTSIASTTKLYHSGRFVALPNVGSPISSKWLHAVAILPLHASTASADGELAPCPYLSMVETTAGDTNLNEATARRLIAEDADQRGRKRDAPPVDPSNTTLFVYGLHQDVSGRLQSDDSLLLQALPGSIKVRRHHAFGFVEFSSHDAATACLGERTIVGVRLQFRWSDASDQPKKQHRSKEDPNSTVLYFKIVDEHTKKETSKLSIEELGETMRSWMEQILEAELGGDVKASDEPAIQVKVRTSNAAFGFLDFASHAAASMVLATLTGSTDGGRLDDEKRKEKSSFEHLGVYLHWGKPASEINDEKGNNVIASAGEFRFERKHFPADSRTDCWFCLASPACEKHLIVGVFDTCYAAQPKGPCHPGHVLLVPVQHDSSGALTNPTVAQEMEELKRRLQKHALEVYDSDLFIFERAMQTKGGYHTHVQCIPVPKGAGPKIRATMLAQASQQNIELRETSSDVPMHSIVGDNGYFFAEILSQRPAERYLYSASAGTRVPLQFGREVLAAVLEKPGLAHWKSCVLDEEKEASVAAAFRESFAKYEGEDV